MARLVERRRAKGTDGEDLLHLWLASGLDDGAIRDEVVTMLLAAHETTANALTWAWLQVLTYPAVLRAIRREVTELGGPDALLELPPKSGALPWTDAVINETLRRFPPVWVTSRGVAEPDTLVAEGHPPVEVRPGTVLLLGIHAMHHDPARWSHPEAFDPERWLRDPADGGVRGTTFPDLAFVPFGTGQRKCIGSHFAVLEARHCTGDPRHRRPGAVAGPAGGAGSARHASARWAGVGAVRLNDRGERQSQSSRRIMSAITLSSRITLTW